MEPRAPAGGPQHERAQQAAGGAGADEGGAAQSDEGETRAAPTGGGQEAGGHQDTGGGTQEAGRKQQTGPAGILITKILIIIVIIIQLVLLLLQHRLDLLLLLLLPLQRLQQRPRSTFLRPVAVGSAGTENQLLLQPVHRVRAAARGVRHQVRGRLIIKIIDKLKHVCFSSATSTAAQTPGLEATMDKNKKQTFII